MNPDEWLRAVARRGVPDNLVMQAAAIIQAQREMIGKMAERIDVMREILAKRAEKK